MYWNGASVPVFCCCCFAESEHKVRPYACARGRDTHTYGRAFKVLEAAAFGKVFAFFARDGVAVVVAQVGLVGEQDARRRVGRRRAHDVLVPLGARLERLAVVDVEHDHRKRRPLVRPWCTRVAVTLRKGEEHNRDRQSSYVHGAEFALVEHALARAIKQVELDDCVGLGNRQTLDAQFHAGRLFNGNAGEEMPMGMGM